MRILVTGGAGYIGSQLIPSLLKKNYHVTIVDNFYYKQNFNLEDKNLEILKGDVTDFIFFDKILKKNFDFIIPLSALVGAPLCEKYPKEAKKINQDSIEFICKQKNENTNIILPTTNSGYGTGKRDLIYDETSPLNPISIYGNTKVNAEKFVVGTSNFIALRLATVFGFSSRMRLDLLVNYFVYQALKFKKIEIFEGKFKRNFVHIKDVVRVFIFCIENFDKLKNNIYNFGIENVNLTKIELAEILKKYIKDFNYLLNENKNDPDKRDYVVSNMKILKTGFEFKYSLEYGIKELIENQIQKLDYNICSNFNDE